MSEDEMHDVNGGLGFLARVGIVSAVLVSIAALTVAIAFGQLFIAAKLMGMKVKLYVSTYGAKPVAKVISNSLGVSTTILLAIFGLFTQI